MPTVWHAYLSWGSAREPERVEIYITCNIILYIIISEAYVTTIRSMDWKNRARTLLWSFPQAHVHPLETLSSTFKNFKLIVVRFYWTQILQSMHFVFRRLQKSSITIRSFVPDSDVKTEGQISCYVKKTIITKINTHKIRLLDILYIALKKIWCHIIVKTKFKVLLDKVIHRHASNIHPALCWLHCMPCTCHLILTTLKICLISWNVANCQLLNDWKASYHQQCCFTNVIFHSSCGFFLYFNYFWWI